MGSAADVERANQGPVLLILLVYAFFLYDSFCRIKWGEFSARSFILAFLITYVFILPRPGGLGACFTEPITNLHKFVDWIPAGILIGGFLLLFHICHQRIFSSTGDDLRNSPAVVLPGVCKFYVDDADGEGPASGAATTSEICLPKCRPRPSLPPHPDAVSCSTSTNDNFHGVRRDARCCQSRQ